MKKNLLIIYLVCGSLATHAQILLQEGFETGTSFPPTGWTLANTTIRNWIRNDLGPINDGPHDFPNTGTKLMLYEYDIPTAANAWAITPALSMTIGSNYTISFWYRIRSASYPEKLKITIGASPTILGQTTTLWNNAGQTSLTNTTYQQATINYTATSTSNFFVGFNCYNALDSGWAIMVDDILIKNASTTPVSYGQFSITNNNGLAQLNWTTLTETNNNGFYIERSSDGSNFNSIDSVASKSISGNSINKLNYSFIDKNTLKGNNYYRLKQVDKDGKFQNSVIVQFKKERMGGLQLQELFPNPSRDKINVIFSVGKNTNIVFSLYDSFGKIVRIQNILAVAGNNIEAINTSSLKTGNYILKILDQFNNDFITTKIVKQ